MGQHQPPHSLVITRQVQSALDEDLGSGDITAALIAPEAIVTANIICREAMIVCGIPWVEEVFRQLNRTLFTSPSAFLLKKEGCCFPLAWWNEIKEEKAHLNSKITLEWATQDGAALTPGSTLCTLRGNARAIVSGERVALNFLQTLSATATIAHSYAAAVAGTSVRILDTRKTLPGLRLAQKYAVRCGGCYNHRNGLFDSILIKENHIQATGSIIASLLAAKNHHIPNIEVEIEVESIAELRQALDAGAKHILLDNFTLADLKIAVAETRKRARLEASGGVTLDNIRAIAETGVDAISIGALTKNIQAIDLSMRIIDFAIP